jgi:hypothetical protein
MSAVFIGSWPPGFMASRLSLSQQLSATRVVPTRPGGIEGYSLLFLMEDGRCLAVECFEPLEISWNQAKTIVGVRKDE